jgi:hypothetical protein
VGDAGYVWDEAYLSFRVRCSVTFFTYSRSMFQGADCDVLYASKSQDTSTEICKILMKQYLL